MINTAVTVVKRGSNYVMSFNGTTSVLNLGSDFIGITDKTATSWIYLKSYGENSVGNIINNGKYQLWVNSSNKSLRYSSDGATTTQSATNSILMGWWYFVAVTGTTNGTANFYIGTKNTAPVLSGTANQNSGTPIAGSTNVFIGNESTLSQTFDGLINNIRVRNKILSLQELTQEWSSTKFLVD